MTAALIPDEAIAGDDAAATLAREIEDKVEGLRDIAGRLAGFLVQFRAERSRQGDLPSVRDGALRELEQLHSGAAAVHQGITLIIDDALHAGVPSPGTTSDAIIAENIDDAWQLCRRELERSASEQDVRATVERLAAAASARADSTTLTALRERLPGYLSERGLDSLVPNVRPRIDQIEAPTLLPTMRVAALARAALEQGWPRVLAAFDLVRGEVAMGNAPVRELPGFGVDEWMPVAQ